MHCGLSHILGPFKLQKLKFTSNFEFIFTLPLFFLPGCVLLWIVCIRIYDTISENFSETIARFNQTFFSFSVWMVSLKIFPHTSSCMILSPFLIKHSRLQPKLDNFALKATTWLHSWAPDYLRCWFVFLQNWSLLETQGAIFSPVVSMLREDLHIWLNLFTFHDI